MQLLIRAINSCYLVHFPERAPLTADDFKTLVREQALWSSSCMIAFEGNEEKIVSVLIGAKHPKHTSILMLGTHPEHLRKGHATHLVDSLGKKLAILGPPRLEALVPSEFRSVGILLEKLGFHRQGDSYWLLATKE